MGLGTWGGLGVGLGRAPVESLDRVVVISRIQQPRHSVWRGAVCLTREGDERMGAGILAQEPTSALLAHSDWATGDGEVSRFGTWRAGDFAPTGHEHGHMGMDMGHGHGSWEALERRARQRCVRELPVRHAFCDFEEMCAPPAQQQGRAQFCEWEAQTCVWVAAGAGHLPYGENEISSVKAPCVAGCWRQESTLEWSRLGVGLPLFLAVHLGDSCR